VNMLGTGTIVGGFMMGTVFYSKARETAQGVGLAKAARAILILEAILLVGLALGWVPVFW
jgi:hypothetical protein